jgi:hypothetical protein
MSVQRYKIALGNARFPLVSTWGQRAVIVPASDLTTRTFRGFQGAEENLDYDIPQILYGENFVPVANGVKSVSYHKIIEPTVNEDFDQIFPLRDADENTVLFSPSKGQNYRYDKTAGLWNSQPLDVMWAAETTPLYLSTASIDTPTTAKVSRAYVDGKTFVAYSRIGLSTTDGGASLDADGSIYFWDSSVPELERVDLTDSAALIINLTIPIGEIGGVSSSNGYLLVWSGLTVYWAPFSGTAFDFLPYANGEVTGAGNQIPEDIQGPITALIPMSGGYIIFTTKNAIAAFYNANNFASPWIFKAISNAGGIEGYEQAAVEGNLGGLYAYTTGGMQRLTLNAAESPMPDVTDFLGGRYFETFNPDDLTFSTGSASIEFFTKVTFCGQRFLVISYGTYPGIYSFALIYDASLQRWGKLRLKHVDAFSYSYGAEDAFLTYDMLLDVSYDDMGSTSYDDTIIQGGALTYPRQSIAFLLNTGEVRLAVMDYRPPDDESVALVVIGKNQFNRARIATLHELQIEGLTQDERTKVANWPSVNGATLDTAELGFLREYADNFYSEYGFDLPTAKNHTFYVQGQFALTTIIATISNDGAF